MKRSIYDRTSAATTIDFQGIAREALLRSRSLVPTLLPEGIQRGAEWIAKNPKRQDKNLGSFKINLDCGCWADFATGDAGGDLISLFAYIGGTSQASAARQILFLLGDL